MITQELPVINLIAMRAGPHAHASGYDRLTDFLDCRVIHPLAIWKFHQRFIAKVGKVFFKRSGSKWYHRTQFYSEVQAARQWLRQDKQIFHFLYGEHSFRYLGNLKITGRRNFVICTYHTPPEKFQLLVQNLGHLEHLDAAIVVSRSQVDFFSKLIGPGKVYYVPHGIDVDYFKPLNTEKETRNGVRCLFVGRHLRDLETLSRAAVLLQQANHHGENTRLAIITSAEAQQVFHGIPNVELYSGISDERLLEFYQQSDIFVLPLLDCTANNSVLEAMACGLPIVSTDLAGVRNYTNNDCALLTPKGDPQALAEAILYLQDDRTRRQKMALASRARALQFRWQQVALQVREIYEQVLAQLL